MSFGFVRRATLAAAEERIKSLEHALREAEAQMYARQVECEHQRRAAVQLDEERRKLTDRVLTMTGQAPLYEAPQIPAANAGVDVKELEKARALPSAGVTFKGVHEAAREAMANGTFDIGKARPRR